MNTFLHGVVRAVTESFVLPEPVLEIGSYQVEGQEEYANLRGLFAGRKYLGLDMRPGPGVDMIADVENLPLPDASVGTALAVSTFEHVPHFWRGFEQLHRVLRADGVLVVACPFYFHIHNYPGDYWRFTPQALDLLLTEYPQRILGWHGPAKRPLNVWAVGFGKEHSQITVQQFHRYKALLGTYARQVRRPGRLLRYRVARLLCGRGPFAPYLDREKWETAFHTTDKSSPAQAA
jgi:SAM-dependent methyltransferase